MQRIEDAGTVAGETEALKSVAELLPDMPWCWQGVPHAALAVGMEAVTYAKAEGGQLDFANDRAANCGVVYVNAQKEIAKAVAAALGAK